MREDFRLMEMSCFGFSNGYRDVHIFQNSLNCTLKMGELIALNYTSIKMSKKKVFTEPYRV